MKTAGRYCKFCFDESCLKAFSELKEKLVSAPIIISPDWNSPFEVMCDASGVALGVVLGQRKNKILHPIYYASKTQNEAQKNYTVTEQELPVVVFAFEKFRSYLLGTRVNSPIDLCERCEKLSWACRFLPEIHQRFLKDCTPIVQIAVERM